MTLEILSPRIMSLRHREEQLEAEMDDAETLLEQRRVELPNTEEIAQNAAEFRAFLKEGSVPENKVLIRNFADDIDLKRDEANGNGHHANGYDDLFGVVPTVELVQRAHARQRERSCRCDGGCQWLQRRGRRAAADAVLLG